MALPTGKLSALLAALTAAGVEVEIVGAGGPGSGPFNTKEELIDFLRNNPKDPTGPAQEAGPQETAPVPSTNEAFLKDLADSLTDLHDHLCPRIKAVKDGLNKVDENSLKRDVELREQISELSLNAVRIQHLDIIFERLSKLDSELANVTAEFRKQAGLLHRRVTKRKQEISTKSNKRKSNRLPEQKGRREEG